MPKSRHEWFLNQVFRHRATLQRYLRKLARARHERTHATESIEDTASLTVYSLDSPADVQLDDRRRFEAFCAAVDQMSPLCRRVFVLRKVDKLSDQEIADVLGVTHRTLEKHVAKGLVRCRDHLRRTGLLDAHDRVPILPIKQIRDRGDAE